MIQHIQSNAKKIEDKGKLIDLNDSINLLIHMNYNDISWNHEKWLDLLHKLQESLNHLTSNEPRNTRRSSIGVRSPQVSLNSLNNNVMIK